MEPKVFVIGDVHGHLDRLEALLKQEGLLVWCEWCNGGGTHMKGSAMSIESVECSHCHGDGWRRARKDVVVVQLGDLGHFGKFGSPTGDMLCYYYAWKGWVDVVLWGNHDRAAVDPAHHATDFLQVPEALHYIKMLWNEGRMQIAFYAHGFVITHAGLAAAFEGQRVDDQLKTDPVAFVEWLNEEDEKYLEGTETVGENGGGYEQADHSALAVINAIGRKRGGRVPTGGILWRDIDEKLHRGFRQIFGHSADHEKARVRYCHWGVHSRKRETLHDLPVSYCIDVGGKANSGPGNALVGIWLPSERIARVDL